ncbi:MAG: outer membrane protein assembly factor BamD [Acidobacteria bacterium]|nr:outer membrane protein assembly factor BamD [Acidobacteriota bacterium]
MTRWSRSLALPLAAVLAASLAACVAPVRMPSPGEREPDKYLFDRGTEALQKKRWLDAREYFQRIIDAYPQSSYRQEARLGIGDAHLGQGGYDQYLLGAEVFREFLRFYPLNPRADYAQYRLGYSQFKQMLSSDRDQTPTLDTLRETDQFLRSYPNSEYKPEVLKLQREARERLSTSDMRVGLHYFRNQWYSGAIPRLRSVIDDDPQYSRRDEAYYYLAESFYRVGRPKEALPYYEKLLAEYQASEFLDRAKVRAEELKRLPDPAPVSVLAAPGSPASAAQ